jgi:copper(I)-binding protein
MHAYFRRAGAVSVCTALALASAAVHAQITVSEPWARATVPGMKATGAYLRIESKSDVRLVAAASPAAKIVEVHEMALVDNVMRMRQVPAIPVAPGNPVELRPGGFHIMLIDLVKPLERGASVPLTLTFEHRDGRREEVKVKVEVRELAAGAPKNHGHGHGHGPGK